MAVVIGMEGLFELTQLFSFLLVFNILHIFS